MKKIDIYIGAALIAISVVVLVMTTSLPAGSGLDVGPGFFPRWGSYLLIILSVLLIIQGFRSKEESTERLFVRSVLIGVALTFGYLLAIYLFGFYVPTIVFLAAFMWIYQYRKWIHIVCVSAFIVLFNYFVFEWFLHVPLPSGLLL